MSDLLITLAGAALVFLLLGTNIYWYRREKTVRESLRTSRQWDERNPFTETGPESQIKVVAEKLDTTVDDVPQVIDSLDNKVRRLHSSLEECRESWAATTRDALMKRGPETPKEPLMLHLNRGVKNDAQALAEAMDRQGLTIVCAHRDGTFIVTSSEESGESALSVAQAALAEVPGGAGGSDCFAQGGGQDETVFNRLESRCQDCAGSNVRVITLGQNEIDE